MRGCITVQPSIAKDAQATASHWISLFIMDLCLTIGAKSIGYAAYQRSFERVSTTFRGKGSCAGKRMHGMNRLIGVTPG